MVAQGSPKPLDWVQILAPLPCLNNNLSDNKTIFYEIVKRGFPRRSRAAGAPLPKEHQEIDVFLITILSTFNSILALFYSYPHGKMLMNLQISITIKIQDL